MTPRCEICHHRFGMKRSGWVEVMCGVCHIAACKAWWEWLMECRP